MPWTEINWPCEYPGITLPQVLFKDPDWFFFMIMKRNFENKGPIAEEARVLEWKAQNIKIPGREREDLVAEYRIHSNPPSFAELVIVPRNYPKDTIYPRLEVIDLAFPRLYKSYDKSGNKSLLSTLKHVYFGNSKYKMTKRSCEAFYDEDDNFVSRGT